MLSESEQETVINIDRESDTAEIYTTIPETMKELDKAPSLLPSQSRRPRRAANRLQNLRLRETFHCVPKEGYAQETPRKGVTTWITFDR